MSHGPELLLFLRGACAMACWVIGTFFWRFWRKSHDRLFLLFSMGFLVFGLHWTALTFAMPSEETRHWFHLIRLAAFLFIIAGVVEKNRGGSKGSV